MIRGFFILLLGGMFAGSTDAQPAGTLSGAYNNPKAAIADEIFLQEVGWQFPSTAPLTSVTTFGGMILVGGEDGLYRVDSTGLVKMSNPAGPIRRLATAGNKAWAI